jgi:hypothetical protein
MRNKRGFELSLNMIITVVLALAFLGIALKIMYDMLNFPPIVFPTGCKISPPDASDPICVMEDYSIPRGSIAKLNVEIYNNEDNDIPASVLPTISCSKGVDGSVLDIKPTTSGQDLSVGEIGKYLIIFAVPKKAARTVYPCTMALSNTQKSFSITIS